MDISSAHKGEGKETQGWQFAVASGVLGWVLDAFNFFVVVFLFDTLSAQLYVSKGAIVSTIVLTLAMRPVGALIFGAIGDRFGRRIPLIVCVVYFSAATVLSGFSPNYTVFLISRGLYGIGMGGYWGIGASYAMESAPRQLRGLLSGMMQGGYPLGYLLAALGMQTIASVFGWRSMFLVGTVLTAIIVVLTLLAPESTSWKENRPASIKLIATAPLRHAGMFAYLLLLMIAMNCLAHGTQDLYPDFLKSILGMHGHVLLAMNPLFAIPILYNAGAIAGALLFGHLSEVVGRRQSMLLAMAICLVSILPWAFGTSILVLLTGSCLMQAGAQGAFGVIPAHLNELSPDAVRSLFPGFVYQLGALGASPAITVEFLLRDRFGYPWALMAFVSCTIVALILLFVLGPEKRGRSFHRATSHETASLHVGAVSLVDDGIPSRQTLIDSHKRHLVAWIK